MEKLLDDEYIEILLHPEARCIEYKYKGFIGSNEFKRVLDHIHDLVIKHKVDKLLVNMLLMSAIPDDIQRWIIHDWFPRVLGVGVKTYALILPESTVADMSVDDMEVDPEDYGLNRGTFSDVEAARKWILSQPAQAG